MRGKWDPRYQEVGRGGGGGRGEGLRGSLCHHHIEMGRQLAVIQNMSITLHFSNS